MSNMVAPVVVTRSGGCEFVIPFAEDGDVIDFPRGRNLRSPPFSSLHRLRSLEPTLAMVEAKLYAANERRQDEICKLKDKLHKRDALPEKFFRANRRLAMLRARLVLIEKQNQMGQNRDTQISKLRDRLQVREEHAQLVREKKLLQQTSGEVAKGPKVPCIDPRQLLTVSYTPPFA